ncbi:hypothetical protein NOF04DRAFT_1269011 [Fusarium oxysporum II5]|nr:hypothetical protein DER44DRAFT_738900 [Fusarium oxysporum]KAK2136932.1 hypothetical protein NOF04DRAFT_1269011 [Fusarium oxysporum II5]
MAQPFTGLYEHPVVTSWTHTKTTNHKPSHGCLSVPTLASTRLHVFGKASTMSTPLCAVLGWFLGFRDRRNTPVFVVSSRTESASLLDTPSETPDLDLNLLWR